MREASIVSLAVGSMTLNLPDGMCSIGRLCAPRHFQRDAILRTGEGICRNVNRRRPMDRDRFQLVAIFDKVVTHRGHSGGDIELLQVATEVKSRTADLRYAVRDVDAFQMIAASKGSISDHP